MFLKLFERNLCFVFNCSDFGKSIKVKGSDTEVNLAISLVENFYNVHQDFSVAISGGGSGFPFTQRNCQISKFNDMCFA